MHIFLRLVVGCILLVCVATGCSTPGIRARQHADAFQHLSPADQKLVLHGHIHPGMSRGGVLIAWGEPDAKTYDTKAKDGTGTETWIYRHRVSLLDPMSFYDYFGPSHGYGDLPPERWLRPGYGAGGIGNEGVLQYQPHVRSLDTVRVAVFAAEKVVAARGMPSKAGPRKPGTNHHARHRSEARPSRTHPIHVKQTVHSRVVHRQITVTTAHHSRKSLKTITRTAHQERKHVHQTGSAHVAHGHQKPVPQGSGAKHGKHGHASPAGAKHGSTA